MSVMWYHLKAVREIAGLADRLLIEIDQLEDEAPEAFADVDYTALCTVIGQIVDCGRKHGYDGTEAYGETVRPAS
jgi:hypothetical protein